MSSSPPPTVPPVQPCSSNTRQKPFSSVSNVSPAAQGPVPSLGPPTTPSGSGSVGGAHVCAGGAAARAPRAARALRLHFPPEKHAPGLPRQQGGPGSGVGGEGRPSSLREWARALLGGCWDVGGTAKAVTGHGSAGSVSLGPLPERHCRGGIWARRVPPLRETRRQQNCSFPPSGLWARVCRECLAPRPRNTGPGQHRAAPQSGPRGPLQPPPTHAGQVVSAPAASSSRWGGQSQDRGDSLAGLRATTRTANDASEQLCGEHSQARVGVCVHTTPAHPQGVFWTQQHTRPRPTADSTVPRRAFPTSSLESGRPTACPTERGPIRVSVAARAPSEGKTAEPRPQHVSTSAAATARSNVGVSTVTQGHSTPAPSSGHRRMFLEPTPGSVPGVHQAEPPF